MPPDTGSPAPNQAYGADWGNTTRWVAAIVLLIAFVAAFSLLGQIFLNLVLSLLLAYILYLPIRILTRRTPLSYGASLAIVFVTYLVIFVVAILFVVPPLVTGLLDLVDKVAAAIETWGRYLLDSEARAAVLDPLGKMMEQQFTVDDIEQLADQIVTVAGLLAQAAGGIGALITNLILIHLLAVFYLIELPQLVRGGLVKLPAAHRREYAILLGRSWENWNKYAWANVLYAIVVGTLNGLQMAVLGIPGAILVGVAQGIAAFIPVIGGFIIVPLIFVVALAQGSSWLALPPLALALLAVAINLVIGLILSQIVFPKIVGSAMSLPVVLIIIGVSIAGVFAGPLGMILISPVLGVLVDLVTFALAKIRGGDPFPGEVEPVFFEGMFEPLT